MIDFYSSFIKYISLWQYKLNSFISSSIRELNDENSLYIWSLVLSISFLYGLIHAAGPGHGKFLVASYFVRGDNNYKDAFKMGYLISIIHSLSALILTFSIFLVAKHLLRKSFNQFSEIAMIVSACIIVIVGIYIIYSSYKNKNLELKQINYKTKSGYFVAFSIGIVPCPGVMTIVLFSMLLKQYLLAILSAIAMSIGMGLTISLVGIASVLFSKKSSSFMKNRAYMLEMASGILIILLGLFLIIGSIN